MQTKSRPHHLQVYDEERGGWWVVAGIRLSRPAVKAVCAVINQ